MTYRKKNHSPYALLLAFIVLMSGFQPTSWVRAAISALSPDLCKIMPLGDSITVGSSSGVSDVTKQISYRKDLWDLLHDDDLSIDFVGSATNGDFYSGFDANHEGHAGWTDAQVAVAVYNWLVNNPPDILLLHIGTNGLSSNPDDVEDILDEIDRYEANRGTAIWVVLARIIDRIPNSPTTTAFNNNVQSMAEDRITGGDKIVIVDMEDGADLNYEYQPDGDMWDSLHPYHTGYTKMASVWKNGIDQVFLQACNNPPSITTTLGNRIDMEGAIISIDVDATDPEGDPLEFSADNLPIGLSINPETGLISGTISCQAAADSPYGTSVTATDTNSMGKDTKSFTWTVTNVNCTPQVSQPANQFHAEGSPVSLQIVATDPDVNDSLQITVTNLPPGLLINQSTGSITGTISYEAYTGTLYTVQVTVTDNGSPVKSSSVSFTWTVTDTNRPPVFDVLPGNQSDDEGEPVSFQILASDPDPEDDTLIYSANGLPEGVEIDPATGLISGLLTYSASTGSPHPVSVTVSDGSDQETADFTWQVSDRNGAPQIANPGAQTDVENQPVVLQIQASDPDQNDTMTFSLAVGSVLPDGLHLDPETGVISGLIGTGASTDSPYSVTVIVLDNGTPQLTDQVTFDWNVVPFNYPNGEITVFLPMVIR